ncbi:MAG: signal peptidase II [Victivallales bacterium]|nr:signal peptidase II [Victivallales bacterium]
MNKIVPGSPEERKILLQSLSLSLAVALLDQICKAAVENFLLKPVELIPGFFNLVIVRNTGAAWGIMSGQRWLLTVISAAFLVGAVLFFRNLTEGWRERFYAAALVVGGVIGNTADRIWRGGAVLDFLDFYLGSWHWPAFNVADTAICVGVGIFILSSWCRPEKKRENP